MKFLPTENIVYKTRLKEEEIIRRLSDYVEPEKIPGLDAFNSGSTKSYIGQINGQTFNIKRIISYRNSFLPSINGIIEKDIDGLRIKVKMRLHIFVIVLLCIWCGGVGLGILSFMTQAFSNSKLNPESIIPFGMLIFAYALTMGAFKYESTKSKKDLQKIFEADIIEG